jgi:phage terminase large subunit
MADAKNVRVRNEFVALQKKFEFYYWKPVQWAYDIACMERLDGWQEETLDALANRPLCAVAGGKGIGKETTASLAVCWFLTTRWMPKVPCTSASEKQLRKALWQEISKIMDMGPHIKQLLEWTPTVIMSRQGGERWQAFQQLSQKTISKETGEKEAEGGAGIHEDNVLLIISEASGVDNVNWDTRVDGLTGETNKCLAIGNPMRRVGRFAECFHPKNKDIWWTRNVDAATESTFVSKDSIKRAIIKHGADSAYVRAIIHGRFPDKTSEMGIIDADMVADAVERQVEDEPEVRMQIGCDIARGGKNSTVIHNRRGWLTLEIDKAGFTRNPDSRRMAVRQALKWYRRPYNDPRKVDHLKSDDLIDRYMVEHAEELKGIKQGVFFVVDDDGIGGAVTDELRERGWSVFPFHFNAAPRDPVHYKQRGDEIWFVDGPEALEHCSIPNDPALIAQLPGREYKWDKNEQYRRVESKDDMQDRGLESPDDADAFLLAYGKFRKATITDFKKAFRKAS